ncbi:6-phospho-3-hexuloisomerase [Tetragenococcus halophilus]|uniref:6-phospho-3-hexuloisomerase n=1 Tax=Tetragenococcus halophilus TaxID=51669 RepID=UPI000B925E02|nr:6-phospho-3-hexuloisomerase [Tetragenococcus halophilus]
MEKVKVITQKILQELNNSLEQVDNDELEKFVSLVLQANKIFLAGTGRSGLAIQAFSNRLMHLGFDVSMIGSITTTSAHKGDLLIIGSGSGETQSLVLMGQKAKENGVKVALNTINPDSTLGKLADTKFVLPGASPKVENKKLVGDSMQPMGSSYEQLSLLIYDAVIISLMETTGETASTMFQRHANLE